MNKLRRIIAGFSVLTLLVAIGSFALLSNNINLSGIMKAKDMPAAILQDTNDQVSQEELAKQSRTDSYFEQAADEYQEKTPLLHLMPYETDSFSIEYLGNSQYEITLKGNNKLQSKQKALNWWIENNINPQKLDLIWN